MLNSSAPQHKDCKDCRSYVLIPISKDEYTDIYMTEEFGAALICKQYGQQFRHLQILWNVAKKLWIGEKRNSNIKNIFIMVQKDINIMANQVKSPI